MKKICKANAKFLPGLALSRSSRSPRVERGQNVECTADHSPSFSCKHDSW